MADLTKKSCLEASGKEWVPGHGRADDCGVKDENKREILKDMLDSGVNIKKSMRQQDDPLVAPSTAECIQESFEKVSGYCREARNRSTTQPSSYDTGDSEPEETVSAEDVEDWMNDYNGW